MSTTAVTIINPAAVQLIPAPTGLSKPLADAYDRAMGEVVNLIDSPDVQSRFAHVMLTQLRTNRALQECTPSSIVLGIVSMAEHGLDPSAQNECWLIPYKGVAQMQTGYGGLLKLALSHPDVLDIYADEVCVNDVYEFYGVNVKPRHVYPGAFQPRGRYIGYYAVAQLTGNRWRAVQMSVEEIKAHAKFYSNNADKKVYSEEAGGGFRGMGQKTVLRKMCNAKYLPMSGKVAALLHTMDTFEGVIDAETQDIRDVARHQLEAGKTAADHIEDLTGQRPLTILHGAGTAPPTPTPAPQSHQPTIEEEITTLLEAKGVPWEEQQALWDQWQRTYPDLTPGALARIRDQLRAGESSNATVAPQGGPKNEATPQEGGKTFQGSTTDREALAALGVDVVINHIDHILILQGLSPQQRTAWKGTMNRKHKVKGFRDIPAALLIDLFLAMHAKMLKSQEGSDAVLSLVPATAGEVSQTPVLSTELLTPVSSMAPAATSGSAASAGFVAPASETVAAEEAHGARSAFYATADAYPDDDVRLSDDPLDADDARQQYGDYDMDGDEPRLPVVTEGHPVVTIATDHLAVPEDLSRRQHLLSRQHLLRLAQGLTNLLLKEEIEALAEDAETPMALLQQKFDEVHQQLLADEGLPF